MRRKRLRFWAWPSKLRELGILGMNRRIADYILPCNPRAHYPRVDDKLLTKQFCLPNGIAVPETYAVIRQQSDLRSIVHKLDGRTDFVVKPTSGSEGRGIMVIVDRKENHFISAGNKRISVPDFLYHLSTILAGLYSLGGHPDSVMLERRIVAHPVFADCWRHTRHSCNVYQGVPVVAMIRLPTSQSDGRANLHQGAVGVGIDLVTGQTFGGVCRSRTVSNHFNTGVEVAELKIPQWETILLNAMTLSDSLEMNYIGVDFILDAEVGPIMLEANARPGLSIQVANQMG